MGKWYKLVFKQNQPIHIGSTKWGVIKETEIFIPGQTMWGALVNTYILQNRISSKNEIENIERAFEKITNFFPSFNRENILRPRYQDGEFYLGDISEAKFRFYFVDTILQTAIEPTSRRAKDESLHEFDFLLPKPKKNIENFRNNLYWIGLINLEELIPEEIENFFKEEELKIYIGGDVKYGFGELKLSSFEHCSELEKWQIENDNNIRIKADENSLYFVEIDPSNAFEGEVRLIPEFSFTQNLPTIKEAKFFASVGSKFKGDYSYSLKKGKAFIPKRFYPNLTNKEDMIPTFGVKATFVTSVTVPVKVVYPIVKEVFDNFETFKKLHPAYSTLTKEKMLQGLTAPLHPGAIKYYKESGLIKYVKPSLLK